MHLYPWILEKGRDGVWRESKGYLADTYIYV